MLSRGKSLNGDVTRHGDRDAVSMRVEESCWRSRCGPLEGSRIELKLRLLGGGFGLPFLATLLF
jgi:hypothetical protein